RDLKTKQLYATSGKIAGGADSFYKSSSGASSDSASIPKGGDATPTPSESAAPIPLNPSPSESTDEPGMFYTNPPSASDPPVDVTPAATTPANTETEAPQ
ncbi:MAG: hypothetical protein LBC65_03430, partial [Oscillospiraceae bacterium]|nr:hypothetical protein [Oscillospiraceae bacterium]